MTPRYWAAAGITVFALTAIPEAWAVIQPSGEAWAVIQPSGVARADVCASVGRRISVSGCTNVADTIGTYAPPPADYAPLPEDYPPPPPGPTVCANFGRRISVSGCT